MLYLVSNGAEIIGRILSHTDHNREYFSFSFTQVPQNNKYEEKKQDCIVDI